MESLRGHLLIASPALLDPNFRRTVVLVTEHTDDGAAGLVLNRPSLVEVAAAVPQLEELVEGDELLYIGGPVQPSAVLVLAEFEDPEEAPALIFEDLGFLAVDEEDDRSELDLRSARVFAGRTADCVSCTNLDRVSVSFPVLRPPSGVGEVLKKRSKPSP